MIYGENSNAFFFLVSVVVVVVEEGAAAAHRLGQHALAAVAVAVDKVDARL